MTKIPKLRIDMLSKATSAPAQGVGSVYIEQTRLIQELGREDFEVFINKKHTKMDIYHIHSVNPSFYGMMTKRRTTVCFVHFLPDTLEGSIRLPKFAFHLFRNYVTKFYRKAKEIVVVNPAFIPPLVDLGISRDRITYIPNFVSEEDFFKATAERKQEFREKYGIPQDRFVVIGVGQVQTRKGVMDFIRTAEMNPDIYFIWAGGFSFKRITDGYSHLKQEMETKRDNLRFLGILDRASMNEVYNASDAFFLPSYNELFPMALLESCNIGLPYVVRDLSIYKDILVGDYRRGVNVLEFSTILKKLRDDPAYYAQSSALSSAMAEKYSRKNVYIMWRDYYWKIYQKYKKY